MENKLNFVAIGIAVIAVVIAIIAVGHQPQPQIHAGGVTNYDEVDATAIKIGGSNGSRVGPVISNTCNLSQNVSSSFAASTTQLFLCAVTGVAASDNIFATLPSGAGTPMSQGQGFHIVTAFATTSGTVGVILSNDIGAATSSFTQATTSVAVLVVHPVTSIPGN